MENKKPRWWATLRKWWSYYKKNLANHLKEMAKGVIFTWVIVGIYYWIIK